MGWVTSVLTGAAVTAALVPLAAVLLALTDRERDRTGEGGLDFLSAMVAQGDPARPGDTYRAKDGTLLGVRRFDSGRGEAPLLVLVHGSGWHGLGMVPLARELVQAQVADVLVPDLRGHGAAPQRRGDVDHIGQLEEDLHALITAEARPGQKVILAGHSSGGGLVVRYAGGAFGGDLDAAILLAPFLQYDAPVTRPRSGGWAQVRLRRIIGLSILNALRIRALNHLHVIDFAFPKAVIDGPLGQTATRSYSYRLNQSYAPRRDYLRDVAKLPRFLLVAGAQDEAFRAEGYEPLMSQVTARGSYRVLEGASHLGLLQDKRAVDEIAAFVAAL